MSDMLTKNELVMVILGVSLKMLAKMTKRQWPSLYVGDTVPWAGFQTEKRKQKRSHDHRRSLPPCSFSSVS